MKKHNVRVLHTQTLKLTNMMLERGNIGIIEVKMFYQTNKGFRLNKIEPFSIQMN